MKNIYWFLWTFLWTWHQKLWIVFCSLWIVMTANQLNSLGVLQYHTTKLANVPVMLYAQTTLSQSLWHWPKYTKKSFLNQWSLSFCVPVSLSSCFIYLFSLITDGRFRFSDWGSYVYVLSTPHYQLVLVFKGHLGNVRRCRRVPANALPDALSLVHTERVAWRWRAPTLPKIK